MEKAKKKKSETIVRATSAMLGFPLISLLLAFGNDIAIDILITIISIICSIEFTHCFKSTKKANPSKWYLFCVSAILPFTHLLSDVALKEILIALIPVSLLVLITELILSKGKKNITDVSITLLGVCYIPLMLVFLSIIRQRFAEGRLLAWYVFWAAWGSDIFAYCIGKKFGKHKYTDISPKKSIEGCVAGVVGAILISLLYTFLINLLYNLSISYIIVATIVLILSIVGQIGDLAASSMKRYCEIKDFGELIPGHGGMLDRIDSVIFILPFAYILLGLLV